MRAIIFRSIAVLAVLLLCGLAFYPPAEKLRRGKDLAGGVSLVYPVEVDSKENAATVLSRTIEVLKQRVNPTGTLDIAMVAQGDNRIEISMPLPSDRVRELRRAFDAALAKVDELSIDEASLERALRQSGVERDAAIAEVGRGVEARSRLVREAAEAYDAARSARRALDEATANQAGQAVIDDLVAKAADADVAYDAARKKVLATSVKGEDLRRALELPRDGKTMMDKAAGKAFIAPSPHERAMKSMRDRHPEALDRIDAAAAAFDAYNKERKGLDDPQDLVRMLRGSGVLDFRIAVEPGRLGAEEQRLRAELRERGPRAAKSATARWYQVENIETWYDSVQELDALQQSPAAFFATRRLIGEERNGQHYVLLYDTPGLRLTAAEGQWKVADAFGQPDQNNLPAIGFRMDPVGARLLGELTGENVQKQMAILLDDKVYTAPTLNSRISNQGVIQGGRGGFKQDEIDYITRTLRAGSVAAKLADAPIQTDITGPELGADNLRKGMIAGIYAFALISVFMALYYFTSGIIAVAALVTNAVTILGLMAAGNAAFTMPGIAGVILTFGMAVDANVLIYERIREEMRAGQNFKSAVRIGFQRAAAAIIDGNLTTLIVALVLFRVGTTEIKGFAVVLGIGIVTTLFAALVTTRVIFAAAMAAGWKSCSMLPMAVPALGRLLEPKVDWIGKRWFFYTLSIVLTIGGAWALWKQGPDMFDNEFRGGTAVTIRLKDAAGSGGESTPTTRTRQQIEDQLQRHTAGAPGDSPLAELGKATVLVINPGADQVSSSTFTIKTTVSDPAFVSQEVIKAFIDVLDAQPPVKASGLVTDPILQPALGDNIGRPAVRDSVADLVGGAVVRVDGITPAVSLRDLESRIERLKSQPDHASSLGRTHRVVVLEGTPDAVKSAAVLVSDRSLSYFDDEARWKAEVAVPEEKLVRDALEVGTSLSGVQSFSPSIADTFVTQAIVSLSLCILGILIYLWVRFGSVRYSLAAVAADLHDAFVAVGMLAVAQLVYTHFAGFSASIGLQPFKINLAMVAAVLTVLGYSLNDTIVTMDRIRENRGKLLHATRDIVNNSINQTFSRTIITSSTTMLSALMLYFFGGESIRGFAYAIFIGVLTGTYSSIGIASPIVWVRKPPARPQPMGAAAATSAGAKALPTA